MARVTCGRGEDDVDACEQRGQLVEAVDRAGDPSAGQLARQLLRAFRRTVGHGETAQLLRGEVPGRERRHLPRPEQQELLALQRREDSAGQLHRGVAHRDRVAPDVGFGADSLRDRKSPAHRSVQVVARGPGRACGLESVFQLPQDLRLADDHRIQARGHAEEVPHRRLALPLVEVCRAGRLQPLAADEVAQRGRHLAGRQTCAIELDAVAGGEHHALRDPRQPLHRRERAGQVVAQPREPLADRQRGRVVREPQQHEPLDH
jgi:hypothetical protein